MTNESIRDHCLGLPHVTEVVQWEQHLLFKVGGKMFAIVDLDGRDADGAAGAGVPGAAERVLRHGARGAAEGGP
jgi:hypothetical protein